MDNSYSIKKIEKKQYVNRRDLSRFVVPEGVEEIEAYAFADCVELKFIAVPSSVKHMVASAFFGCEKLTQVHVYEGEFSEGDISLLPARARELSNLCAVYVRELIWTSELSFSDVGSEEWLSAWDKAFSLYLGMPDETGFFPFNAGGEEDYEDALANPEYYIKKIRMKKANYMIDRLLCAENCPLLDEFKKGYTERLLTNEEALEALMQRTEKIPEAVALFDEIGLLPSDIEQMLRKVPESAVELRAELIKRQKTDIFSALVL